MMQRRLLIYWLAALLLSACTEKPQEQASPAVWMVRDNDTTLFLTGTVHFLPDGVNWKNGPIVAAIARADAVVTELSPDQLARVPEVASHYSSGQPATDPRKRFSPDLRDSYIKVEASALPSRSSLAPLDDWALALMLARVSADKAGLDPDNGVDSALINEFRRSGKPRLGLERPEDQFGAFDAIPPAEQRQMLNRLMRDIAAGRSEQRLRDTVDAWANGDMERLATIVMRDTENAPNAHRLLLVERNRRWADWMERRLDEPGSIMVAVGVGHLAGPDSLIAMLAARGIKTERLQ